MLKQIGFSDLAEPRVFRLASRENVVDVFKETQECLLVLLRLCWTHRDEYMFKT
jgi:hypothetical protein